MSRKLVAEALGTGLLVAAVVGSGIMAERLFPESVGLALLANSIATGCALVALILALGDISAHFNPLVSFAEAWQQRLSWSTAAAYSLVQVVGGIAGVAVAHVMFGNPVLEVSPHVRTGIGLWCSEAGATFGLVLVISGVVHAQRNAVAFAVGAYITAAYWFTSSTSFANPAVTIARAFTATFAGIRPPDVLPFLLAQAVGAAVAVGLCQWLRPSKG
jgi:glycerol uptake facilitator-like aquaporin